MHPKLEQAIEQLEEIARENPLVFAAAAIVVLLVALLWNALFLVLRGLLFATIALALIFGAILLWAKIHYRKPSLKSLFAEKKRLLEAIRIAEKKYMQRKLSEKDFNGIFKEKQRLLIGVEAMIDQQYNRESSEKIGREILDVQAKKRHVLRELLDEKMRLIREMDLMEKSYLKRKIDSKTYQEMVQKNQHELVEIEADIKSIYEEANVSKVMSSLKEKLAELEKRKKESKKKKKDAEEQKQIRVAKEIAEQISRG